MTNEQLERFKRYGIPIDDGLIRLAQIGEENKAKMQAAAERREAEKAAKNAAKSNVPNDGQADTKPNIAPPGDYFTALGIHVKYIPDSFNYRYMLFTTSKKDNAVEKAIAQGHYILITNGLNKKTDEMYALADKSNHEHLFAVGKNSTYSTIFEGTEGKISSEQVTKAYREIGNAGDETAYTVHIHENVKNQYGEIIKRGKAEPSGDDMNTNKMEIILGFEEIPDGSPGSTSGSKKVDYRKQVGFYNSSGLVDDMRYDSFVDAIKKINNWISK